MDTTAHITTRPGTGQVQVEISYDGTRPPRALFADLAMIGWEVPALAPPPREAIDWTVPNPETGERFTVRSYVVDDAIVEAPKGSGPRGTWTEPERGVFLATVQRVLARHGLFDEAALGSAPDPSAPTLDRRPPPPAPMPVAADPTAEPAVRTAQVDLDPALRDPIELLLLGSGVEHRVAVEERSRTQSFRGSVRRVPYTVLTVELTAPAPVALRLLAAIDRISTDAAARAAQRSEPAAVARVVGPRSGRAHIAVVALPPMRSAIAAVATALGLEIVGETPATVQATESFRGSSHQVDKPAIRVVVDVPADQVVAVSSALAEAGRVSAGDPDRLQVELAPPVDRAGPTAEAPRPADPADDQSGSSRSRKNASTWSSATRVG